MLKIHCNHAHTKRTCIDYARPQDNPNISKEKLHETVHSQLSNACLFTLVRDTWNSSESLTSLVHVSMTLHPTSHLNPP